MGLFSKLFKKPVEEVNLLQLLKWYKSRTIGRVKKKSTFVEKLFDDFKQQIHEIEDSLVDLENAKLKNPNVPENVKKILHGNRENFIKNINYYISIMPDFNRSFHEKFKKHMAEFATKSRKNITILQEFFKDETNNILKQLAILEKLSENIGDQDKEMLKLHSIKLAIDEIFMIKEEKERINDMISTNNRRIKAFANEIKDVKKEVVESHKSKKYANLIKLKELVEKQTKSLQKTRDDIIQRFSPLSKSFKKYAHYSKKYKKIIENYLKDPFDALIEDSKLKICDVLHDLSYDLSNLDLEKKEIEKVVNSMNKLQMAKLKTFQVQLKELKDTARKSKWELEKNNVLGEIERKEKEVKKLELDRNNLIDDNEGHLKILQGIEIKRIIDIAEKKINSDLGVNIKIIIPNGFD